MAERLPYDITIGYDEEFRRAIEGIRSHCNLRNAVHVIRNGVALLQIAVEEERKGNKLGVIRGETIIREITIKAV